MMYGIILFYLETKKLALASEFIYYSLFILIIYSLFIMRLYGVACITFAILRRTAQHDNAK